MATLILIVAIIIVGREQNLFRSTMTIYTNFNDVKGLKIGNNVRLTGIEVGSVVDMVILSDTSVSVEMSIDSDVAHFIRKNSTASIANDGLMGNKIMVILPGTNDSPSIEQGDILRSVMPVEIDDIINEIKLSSEKINVVSSNLIGITDKINRGDGIFGKIFTDTTFTRNLDRTSENVTEITDNLIQISNKVNSGYGVLGKLLTDTTFTLGLDTASRNLNQISQNLIDITDKINKGEGIFGRLFTDTSLTNNLYLTSRNLEASTYNLYELSKTLNNDKSALGTFIADTTFSDSLQVLLRRLNEGIKEATEASEAIQRSGLIRLFSKDPDKQKSKARKEEQGELEDNTEN